MLHFVFKNLDPTELAKEAVRERMTPVLEKFPGLASTPITVTLEMQNSPLHAGPDLFVVKIRIRSGPYKGLNLGKEAPNLYTALADVVEHLLEAVNRFGDRSRAIIRQQERNLPERRKSESGGIRSRETLACSPLPGSEEPRLRRTLFKVLSPLDGHEPYNPALENKLNFVQVLGSLV